MCGGYNPKGWIGLGEDRDAIAAFLFTWPDGDTSKRPIKLQKVPWRRFKSFCCNPAFAQCDQLPIYQTVLPMAEGTPQIILCLTGRWAVVGRSG